MARVNILIFTCNRPQDLKRCLESVAQQTFTDSDLIVVDNGDSAETDNILSQYPAKVIKDKTKRLSYLFNLGWKSANHEIIAYLADDAELKPNWLEEGLISFKRNPQAAVITGPLVSPFEFTGEMHAMYSKGKSNKFIGLLAGFYNKFILEGKAFQPCVLCESGSYSLGQGFLPDFKEEREVDLATTSSMMIKRSAISSVGGFDENFIFNHADGDLFVRLKKSGYKIIYNPDMQATHYIRIGPSRYPFFIGRDTAYFYLKDIRPGTLKGFLAALANICVLNIYWLYKTIQLKDSKQLMGITGFLKGMIDYIKK